MPQVSWIVAPEAYTEHPNWPANYGAWYVSQMLDALTANPAVWGKTVFIWMFDENDGFFDHMVPPTPPQSRSEGISTVPTTNEIFNGSPQYPTSEYPAGPYGTTRGATIENLSFTGWHHPDSAAYDVTKFETVRSFIMNGIVFAAVLIGTSAYFYTQQRLLLDFTYPLASTTSIYLTLVFSSFVSEQKQRLLSR